VLSVAPTPFRKTRRSEHETDAYDDIGLYVYYKGSEPVVDYLEMFHAKNTAFLLESVDIFRTKSEDLIDHLFARSTVIEEEPGCSYIFQALELSLWRSELPEGDQFDRFDAIGIGCKGYYSKKNREQGAWF